MVDLRIDVIRASRQYDARTIVFLHPFQSLSPGFPHIRLGFCLFFPDKMHRCSYFTGIDLPFFPTKAHQSICCDLFTCKGDERTKIANCSFDDVLYVVFQIFRIGYDDRTVIVILGIRCFLPLIKHTWMKDRLDSLIDEPLHMSM